MSAVQCCSRVYFISLESAFLGSSGVPQISKLPLGLTQALERGECVLFLGAGVGSHYKRADGTPAPDGSELAKGLISHFKLGIEPTDLPRVAELVEMRKNRADLEAYIRKSFQGLEPDEHIRWLTSFRWRSIFTTNYDMGLERAYKLNAFPPQNPCPIAVTADLRFTDNHVDVPIFHLHGTPYIPCASPIVITQSDYARYKDSREMVWARLKSDCATSTILYVGYSGRDPNWQLIIEEVAREFAPSKPPTSYRIDPFADPIDIELHRGVRRVETLVMTLPELHSYVEAAIGDYRASPNTFDQYKDRVPHHLRELFDKGQAPMLRLLDSWTYVNGETVTDEPNTKDFLRGSKPNWSLIAQNHRFTRDIEDEVWEWILDFETNTKARSTAVALLGPAGYGLTTILMALALKLVDARIGPVFILKEGAEVHEGDVAYAASLFQDVACHFIIDQAKEHAGSVQAVLTQQRRADSSCLFILGERTNEWLSAKARFLAEEFDVTPLSDGEINRLLDFLAGEGALGEMEHLDRSFQFSIVKTKHEMQLLVAMREATAGDGVGFDAIIENEYRGIEEGKSSSLPREFYLLVCCFYQHGMLIRDQLLESILGLPLLTLHHEVGTSLEGLVDYAETGIISGQLAARARHRTIAQIVWKKCGSKEHRERLLQKAMEKLNLTYPLDKRVFDLFIQSEEIVDTFSSLEGKIKFFETAARRDSVNPFVLQHFARMLLREKRLTLALTQIDNAILKDTTKSLRPLHHTRGLIFAELAMTEESGEVARRWMLQSEKEFLFCIAAKEADDYGHSGLATLYLRWSRRQKVSVDEATEYLQKAEAVVSSGLRVVKARSSLLIISSDISKDLGRQPERLSKLRQAVDADKGSPIGRFLLGRAYRQMGEPAKALNVLDPVIKTDFKDVRAYVEYTRALLQTGESVRKCCATLSQCRLDGENDAAFIGLYGGLLFCDERYADAIKLFDDAKAQGFSYEERFKQQYTPTDPQNPSKPIRFSGIVQQARPGITFLLLESGPVVITTTTAVSGIRLVAKQKVTFELTFSARGPFADHLAIA